MSDGSVFDDVRSMDDTSQVSSAPPPSVFDEVRSAQEPAQSAPSSGDSDLFASPVQSLRGVAETGMAVATGTGRAMANALNDLLPDGFLGNRAQEEANIRADPLFNYTPQTPEGKYLFGRFQQILSPIASASAAAHDFIARSFGNRAADVTGDIATLAPFGAREASDIKGMVSAGDTAIESGHPLTGAAQAEESRLTALKQSAEESGYDLPEGGTAARHARAAQNNTPLVNADVRTDLNLPKNAPLTPNMLADARRVNASPAYQAVENLQEPIPLDQRALEAARTDNLNATPSDRLPFPQGPTITGEDAVDFSKKARFLANQMEKNPANPFAAQDAQMYRDAAEAVEDSVRDHLAATGREQLADNWDAARVYTAKTYSVEHALDGAGNVRAADLKAQLFKNGKPLSGKLEQVATLAAQYPEAFRTTRVTAPQVSLLKRGAAAALPFAGAAAGGSLGGGMGAAAGEAAGAYAGNKLLGQ